MKYINDIPFLFIALSLIIYIPLRYWYNKRNRRTVNPYLELVFILLIVYIESLLYLTIIPSSSSNPMGIISVNFIPFQTINRYLVFEGDIAIPIINLIGNVVVFIPIGLFAVYFKRDILFWHIFLIGLASTFFIEIVQLILSALGLLSRSFDIDDLILNTIGVLTGYFLFRLASRF